MTRPQRHDSPVSTRAVAGLLSVGLHVGLVLLILLSGGRRDGMDDDATPLSQLVYMDLDLSTGGEGVEPTFRYPDVPTLSTVEQRDAPDIEPPTLSPVELETPRAAMDAAPLVDLEVTIEAAVPTIFEPLEAFVLPQAQASALLERVERLAEELVRTPRTRTEWQQDGRQFDAELVLAPAVDGIEPDRVIAQVSAEDQGRRLTTRIMLKRLPYSHFVQLIDRWNPLVQLHDDQIVGRMHVNSRINLLHDAEAKPTFLGKVTTTADGFNLRSHGRNREREIFGEGIETRARRVPLTVQKSSIEQARGSGDVRLHDLAGDTVVTFFPDGSYAGRDRKSGSSLFSEQPAKQSVYFVAARGATVYVQGVVSGRYLVYSPKKIVVEGNLVYARDPREDPESDDFLGLVCDRDIVVAPPWVTGPGDLRIHGALFAKRRVVVTNIEYSKSATLEILGSLTAGTLTASEPRYATKIEYDWRFERQRPPGFPSTDRFAAEDWDGRWTEVANRPESTAF